VTGQLHAFAASPNGKIPWVDPRADLAALKKSFSPYGDQMIHQMSSLQAGHYTDHTIPTHATLHSEIILYSNSECF